MASEELFDCSYPDCDYKSLWIENVGCHERGHDPIIQWRIPCQVCPQIFRSLVSFFHHMSSQHSNNLCCPLCLFRGADLTEYKAHILAHDHSEESFQDLEFAKPNAAGENSTIPSVDETLIEGATEIPIEKVNIEGENFYSCTICGHKTKRRDHLKAHLVVHTDHRPFSCPVKGCKYRAKLLHILKKHSRDVHHINLPSQKYSKTSKEATSADEISTILSVDESQSEEAAEIPIGKVNIDGETYYSCTICSHKTKRRESLKDHLVVHTDRRPFSCPVEGCKYRAKLLRTLKKHCKHVHHIKLSVQKNSETRKEATTADETSTTPPVDEGLTEGAAESWMEKVDIEGETFYSCTICSHKTKRRENLKAHLVVHTDYRPFSCPVKGCKYRAKLLHILRKHSKQVHHINLPSQKNSKTRTEATSADETSTILSVDEAQSEEAAEISIGNVNIEGETYYSCINNFCASKNTEAPNEILGSHMNCDNQAEVDINGANFGMAFACTLCEFIGDSELAAFEHSQLHQTSYF